DVPRLSSAARFSMQVRLTAASTATVHYGPQTGTDTFISGAAGFQNGNGSLGMSFLAEPPSTCTPQVQTACCSRTGANCTLAAWVPNLKIVIGDIPGIELAVTSVGVANLVVEPTDGGLADGGPGGNITFDVNGTLRNFGRTDAGDPFIWRAYLSTTSTKPPDGGVIQVYESPPMTLGALSQVTVTGAAGTTTAPPRADYFVLIEVDPTNVVTESTKSNNVGATIEAFTNGLDLVGRAVTGVASSGGGNVDAVRVQFYNRGTEPAGTMTYRILLSADQVLDAADFPIHTGTRVVTGAETVDETVSVTMPANAPNGMFYYLLQLDSTSQLTETNETNNVAASGAQVNVRRADLVAESFDLVDPLTGGVISTLRFGEPARVIGRFSNQGGANAANFRLAVVLSTDRQLSLLSDKLVAEQTVTAAAAGGPSQNVPVDFVMPTLDRANVAYPTGQYFVFFVVDSLGSVFEVNKGNNSLVVGPVRSTAPGPDFVVSTIQAPAVVGAGDAVPLFRTLRNLGNLDGPAAGTSYRFYASANDIITTDDVQLPIVAADGTTSSSGTVTLARGAAQSMTEVVRVPASLAPGSYYIGCLIDPEDASVEWEEANNALASSVVQLTVPPLRVATQQLPDATIGQPYVVRLAAQGARAAVTWSLDAVQGSLPAGLTLSTDGLLSGTPTGGTPSVVSFTAVVSEGTRSASARVVIRVLLGGAQLVVTSANIPAIVNTPTSAFQFLFGASGGSRPYSWRVVSGTLPAGMALSVDGLLAGAPRAGTADGTLPIGVEVRDAVGSVARRDISLRLVAAGSIAFRTITLPNSLVGAEYTEDIAVANADNSALAKPLHWSSSGALPDGLSLMEASEIITLSGKALKAGVYSFTLSVEDARGRTDSLGYTVVVYPSRLKISASNVPTVLRPGEENVNVVLSVMPATAATYRIEAGRLPPGLALSTDGIVSGTVATENVVGTHTFVVEARDATGATGLAPFSLTVEEAPRRQGCTAAGGPLSVLSLLVLASLRRGLGRSRRALGRARRQLAPLAGVAAAMVALTANAQSYIVEGPTPVTYTPLPSTATTISTSSLGTTVTLPFTFLFYGQPVTSVGFSIFGYLAFAGSDSGENVNTVIPQTSQSLFVPETFVAPWWDSLSTGSYKWIVLGTAPTRIAAFEWNASSGSFQALLYESTGQIRFVYGPGGPSNSSSASVGIQRLVNDGLPGLGCTPSCRASGAGAEWPTSLANKALDFYTPADLRVTRTSADQAGYAGVTYRASATVRNDGGRAASNVTVRFYLSTDAQLDPLTDAQIGDAVAALIPALAEQVVAASTLTIPSGTAPGSYFVIPQIDPSNAVAETNDTNNIGTPLAMVVAPPKPDLLIAAMTVPTSGSPGAMVQASRTLRNAGNAAAPAFTYTWFVSDNAVISISDTVLGASATSAGLAAGQNETATETLTLPATLQAGPYWLGLCVNFDAASTSLGFGIDEISFVNNCSTSAQPVVITNGEVVVVTTALPGATQYAPYALRLEAGGGSGTYSWALSAGSLPAGLTLSAAGDLAGVPAVTGTFSIEATVTSGASTKAQALSLEVSAGSIPLVVADQVLPSAEFGRAYSTALVAVGGKPPYRWQIPEGSVLPFGLALSPDGFVEGRAGESGEKLFAVEVTDAAMATSRKELSLRVVNPTTLSVATNVLPSAFIRRDYAHELIAVGGRAPYDWSLVRFQQLPENPTEQPGAVLTAFPDGFGVAIENGTTNDFLRGTPALAGLYSLTLKVTDTAGTVDTATVLLHVTYAEGLAITTTVLPDAFINQPYQVKLSHNGGRDAMGITFSEPCVWQAVRPSEPFVCAARDTTQKRPEGLDLVGDGTILGTPTAAEGTYSFLVKVVDSSGRQDTRGLSIRVRPDYAPSERGGCASIDPLALGLGAVVLAALRRRRS
ncbi:MAG: putative Ig domain-containing protein, partial [Archangium sp.]|nr:putative Ig domain-containing protein [Archangium sp.]